MQLHRDHLQHQVRVPETPRGEGESEPEVFEHLFASLWAVASAVRRPPPSERPTFGVTLGSMVAGRVFRRPYALRGFLATERTIGHSKVMRKDLQAIVDDVSKINTVIAERYSGNILTELRRTRSAMLFGSHANLIGFHFSLILQRGGVSPCRHRHGMPLSRTPNWRFGTAIGNR